MAASSDAVDSPSVGAGLFTRVLGFVGAVRDAGVGASQSQAIDVFAALPHVDLLDRDQLREALAAVLVSDPRELSTHHQLFDLWFPARSGSADGVPVDSDLLDDDALVDDDAVTQALVDAITAGDDDAITRLARQAVDAWGRVEGRDGQPQFFNYRVRRRLDPHTLLDTLLAARGSQDDTALTRQLTRDEYQARLQAFQEEVEAEIRRRAVDRHGPQQVGQRAIEPALKDVDFLRMSAAQAAQARTLIAPLARKLASRTQVKRRVGRTGRLDIRKTVRRSLATGGVPFDPAFRPHKPHKPELFVITDVSGSVASFARFTLMLVHTLQEQFSKVRSFAFIDNLDEVTHLFDGRDFTTAMQRMLSEADLVWLDGHSDYGRSLTVFHERHARDVTAKSTVLVLGDARNNHRAPAAWVMEDLARRARAVHWLNPEARTHWGTGDSITRTYAPHLDQMVEVRNLSQLSDFVAELT